MIGVAAKNPKLLTPIAGVVINAPVHLKKEVLDHNSGEKVLIPLCGENPVPHILLTDDIHKCTCKDCVNLSFNSAFIGNLAYIFKGVKEQ